MHAALGVFVALAWGSSFLMIEWALDSLGPFGIAFMRMALAAGLLSLFPEARRPLPSGVWPRIAVLAVVWMTFPMVLFPLAEQHITSSVAGMINGSIPLFTALVAALWLRQAPTRGQTTGLLIGFAGVLVVSLPGLGRLVSGGTGMALGIGFALLATAFYGIANNMSGPLQRAHGALPIVWRGLLIATLLLLPLGAPDVAGAEFTTRSVVAMLILGGVGTGLAFTAFATLSGGIGGTRASVVIYFIPVVALVLGTTLGGEPFHPSSIAGVALVLLGAALVQGLQLRGIRARRAPEPTTDDAVVCRSLA